MKQPNKADLMIYKAFSTALNRNLLRLYLDTSKLNRPTSPVYNPWENLLPLLIPMIIGLVLIVTVGSLFGLAFIIGMVLVYNYYIKRLIDKRLLERTKKFVAQDYQHCQELWEFGGLVLATADNKKTGCIAPEGDWKDFIVQRFSDFMIDKKEENEPSNEKPAA
ncbi:MAG: hypothetical protein IJ529_05600 [Alphaproteobacteria bacterium]|nr:hypothetical protein [Alphaproteobacteria bacterium]MBQ8677923.1 hypothetical protein [Alphaproteobacteria bacterium]